MKFMELQIVAMSLALICQILLIFKKKNGWLIQIAVAILFLILNYLVELYFLTIPCFVSGVVSLCGWFKWRKDEKKNALKEASE